MKVPHQMRDIYISYLKLGYSFICETLTWAFPETYKIHICDGNWSHIGSNVIVPSYVTSEILDSIVKTYMLKPGEIRDIAQ